jgi:hypothetical protein
VALAGAMSITLVAARVTIELEILRIRPRDP